MIPALKNVGQIPSPGHVANRESAAPILEHASLVQTQIAQRKLVVATQAVAKRINAKKSELAIRAIQGQVSGPASTT